MALIALALFWTFLGYIISLLVSNVLRFGLCNIQEWFACRMQLPGVMIQ